MTALFIKISFQYSEKVFNFTNRTQSPQNLVGKTKKDCQKLYQTLQPMKKYSFLFLIVIFNIIFLRSELFSNFIACNSKRYFSFSKLII